MEFLEKIVKKELKKIREDSNTLKTNKVIEDFFKVLERINDNKFIDLLIKSGYIPDLYEPDSREETLYTKLCEAMEVEWAKRMGYDSYTVTQKSSYEDVVIKINKKTIVSDTKTFRLSRSQLAPNVKDFVKPEDYKKWLERHEDIKLGGLVVYPQLHEWVKGSDAHSYCSDKENPIVMLPFHYLGYLLYAKNNNALKFKTVNLEKLWEYERIFPQKTKNRILYWKTINKELLKITGDSTENFKSFLKNCDDKLYSFVKERQNIIEKYIKTIEEKINSEVDTYKEEDLRKLLSECMKSNETKNLIDLKNRITNFRFSKDHTKYFDFIEKGF